MVYSPRPDRFAESSSHVRIVSRIRARAEALVRRFAWRGMYLGTVVVHLYRGCDGRYEEWGPHAHVLCPGVDVRAWRAYSNREWNRYHRETGEVLKQIRYESGEWVSYRGRGLERHLVYELGHAAILPDRHALSWFGDLKTWAQPEIPPGEEEVPCCTWGDPMAPFSWRWGLPEIDEDAASFVAIAPDHTPIEFTIIGGDPPDDNRVLTDEEIAERLSRTETREEYDARILREQDEEDRRRWGP